MRKIALALLILVSTYGFGASYYISATGNDSATGTSPSHAWKTLGRVNSAALETGDEIYFHGGNTFAGTLSISVDGLSVRSYGSGDATIDAGSGDGIDIYDAGGASISGLEIKGGWNSVLQSGSTGSGVNAFCDLTGAKKLQGLSIVNVSIHGFQQCGIVVGAWPSDGSQSGFSSVLISCCRAYSNGQAGIESYGYFDINATTYAHTGFVVEFCTVYDNEGLSNSAIATGNGIVLGQVQNAKIQYCESYQNGALNTFPTAGPVGIWAWDSDDVTIQNCESHHNQSSTFDGDGFDLDGGVINSVMQYNYSHDNVGAGLLIAEYAGAKPQFNLTIRYNISQNDGVKVGGGVILWSGGTPVHQCQIYNNTIFTTQSTPAINISCPAQNVGFRNNVIISANSYLVEAPAGQTDVVFQANDYWGNGAGFSMSWQGADVISLENWRSLGQEASGGTNYGLWCDPQYADLGGGGTIGNPTVFRRLTAYRLKLTSPMVKAGIPMEGFVGSPGSCDFYGDVLRTGPPDIGAVQATRL